MLKFQWLNCLCLLIPVLAWNAIFSSKLVHTAFEFDEIVSPWILLLENVLRLTVFVVPLFMPLRWDISQSKIGIAIYAIGVLIYFVSWIPLMVAPQSTWSNSLLGFLAPAYTPLLWLIGIGLIGGWWPYLVFLALFAGVHVGHWGRVYARTMW